MIAEWRAPLWPLSNSQTLIIFSEKVSFPADSNGDALKPSLGVGGSALTCKSWINDHPIMLWILTSLFFSWCAFREIRRSIVPAPGFDVPTPISKPYLAIVLALAVLFAWPPVHTWYFEWFLSRKATELADNHRAKVHCNTTFDTMLDPEMLAAGHANPKTGKIVIQKPWCDTLMSYLRHPNRATDEELESLDMFTHESMHVRGELNEALTECEAVQRNYRAAKLLGVSDGIAKRNARDYYSIIYHQRGEIGGMQGAYYSDQCAVGKAMDEHLEDSTWATP